MFREKVINSDLLILRLLVLSWIEPNQGQNTSLWAWHCWTPGLVILLVFWLWLKCKVIKENGRKNDKMDFCENHNSFAPLQHTPALGGHHYRLEDDNYILHYGPSKILCFSFHIASTTLSPLSNGMSGSRQILEKGHSSIHCSIFLNILWFVGKCLRNILNCRAQVQSPRTQTQCSPKYKDLGMT